MCVTICFRSIALKCKSGIWCSFPQTLLISSPTVCVTQAAPIIASAKKLRWEKCPCYLRPHEVIFHLLICFQYWLCCLLVISSPLCVRQRWRYADIHVSLPDKNLQEYLTPNSELWPHLPSSPFTSLPTSGSLPLVKTKSFSFLLQFLYLKLV